MGEGDGGREEGREEGREGGRKGGREEGREGSIGERKRTKVGGKGAMKQTRFGPRLALAHLFSHFVNLCIEEGEIWVKVLVPKHTPPRQLVGHLSFHLHHQLQHVVVGFAREQDLAGVELIQSAANCPHVHCKVILHTYDCGERWRREEMKPRGGEGK